MQLAVAIFTAATRTMVHMTNIFWLMPRLAPRVFLPGYDFFNGSLKIIKNFLRPINKESVNGQVVLWARGLGGHVQNMPQREVVQKQVAANDRTPISYGKK